MLKEGVSTRGIRPELVIAILAAKDVYDKYGVPFIITSLTDGVHSPRSLHYAGCAVDLRTRDIRGDHAKRNVCEDIKIALGGSLDYDVVLEKDHIHLEYQPKRFN